MDDEVYPVGEVARMAGVSVRTLHHYDQIGLLSPGGRSAAGYRLYSRADLARLRQILSYRALGFGLDEIAEICSDPAEDADSHLRAQHRLLREQISSRQQMLAAIEKEMEARQMGIDLTPQEQLEVFGTGDVTGDWADEAGERWGGTDAYQQSQRRARAYAKQDWQRIKAESDAICSDFAAAMAGGEPADGPVATAIAERHRQHIGRWFYDCTPGMHRGLGDLYVTDPRFTAYYDKLAPGLARYVSGAIRANPERPSPAS